MKQGMALCGGWIGLYQKIYSLSLELTAWQLIHYFMMSTLCTTLINQTINRFQLDWIAANTQIDNHNQTLIDFYFSFETLDNTYLQTTIAESENLL